jgi:pantetheine-phosphate adenylyltransferase
MNRAVYPGSFDPVTNGHLDIIQRSAKLFDEVIVAVAENPNKHTLFTLKERVKLLKYVTKNIKNVSVDYFHGLLVEYVKRKKCSLIIRGLRAVSDFEYEFQMALMNRKINPDVEIIYMMPAEEYTYLSSSIVKEIASLHGDVSKFVPAIVKEYLDKKFKK